MTQNKNFGLSARPGLVASLVIIALAAVFITLPSPASAVTKNKPATKSQSNQKPEAAKGPSSASESYNYVAQPGDSYTLMARKAVQTYGIDNKVKLSGAQIIFCETNLTQDASSPLLEVSQEVAISKNDVSAWVKKAQQLTSAQIAAWNYYVQFVNFNTDNVGEASS